MKNYEKAYKEALERAKKELDVCGSQDCDAARQIFRLFPELKESEDEKIRKGLIENFKWFCGDYPETTKWGKDDDMLVKDIITWLEKQESLKDIIDRYKDSWYNEGKIAGMAEGLTDDEKYQQGWHDALEKQDKQDAMKIQSEEFDDNIITSDDEILQAISIGLTDIIEDFGWPEFGGLPIEEIQNWLDKQSERKSVISDDALKEGIAHFGITQYQIDNWLKKYIDIEKQCKPANKLEPKFKVGDWIVGANNICKIISLNNELNCYIAVTINNEEVKIPYYFDDGQGHMYSYHLWSIEDAKPGDVLVDVYGNIGIYEKCVVYDWISYCSFGSNGGFQNFSVPHEIYKTYPATKVQRDLLFSEIKEAGYEWDDETKAFY